MHKYDSVPEVVKTPSLKKNLYYTINGILIIMCGDTDYVPIGPRFSNLVLQALLVLLKKTPPHVNSDAFTYGSYMCICDSVLIFFSIIECIYLVRLWE